MKTCDLIWMLDSFTRKLSTIRSHIESNELDSGRKGIDRMQVAIYSIMATEKLEKELVDRI